MQDRVREAERQVSQNQRVTADSSAPSPHRISTEPEPSLHRIENFQLKRNIINYSRKLEIEKQGYEFCSACKVKVPSFLFLLEEHHLIPKRLQEHPFFNNATNNLKQIIKLCGLCHKIAHILINDAEKLNFSSEILFWEEKELREEIQNFRKNFTRKAAY